MMLVENELKIYIRKALKNNFTFSQIEESLRRAGHPDDLIKKMIAQVQFDINPPSMNVTVRHFIMELFMAFVLFVFLTLAMFFTIVPAILANVY
jgi:hypothetical protein